MVIAEYDNKNTKVDNVNIEQAGSFYCLRVQVQSNVSQEAERRTGIEKNIVLL